MNMQDSTHRFHELISIPIFVIGILIIMLLLASSCDKESIIDPPLSQPCQDSGLSSLQIVTGIFMTDANASPIGSAGNPNTAKSESLSIYPNPNSGVMQIFNITTDNYIVHFVPAVSDNTCTDFDFSSTTFDYPITDVQAVSTLSITLDSSSIAIQMPADAVDGYYKILFYNDSKLEAIENFYFDRSTPSFELVGKVLSDF